MSKHTIEERAADIKRAQHEAQHQRQLASVELTPEQIRMQRIIRRNLAQRRQELRAKREKLEYHEHAKRFNNMAESRVIVVNPLSTLCGLFAKPTMKDFA